LVKPSRLLHSPSTANFGDVRRGQSASKEILLPESGARHFEIGKVVSDMPFVTTAIATRADKTGYLVTLNLLTDDAPIGELKGNVTIYTDHPKDPKVEIPVTAMIRGDIGIFPDNIFFGLLKEGDGGRRSITMTNAGDRPLVIESIDSPSKSLLVRAIPKTEGKDYRIVATMLRSAPKGYLKTEVTVHTNDPVQPSVRIPVYALTEE
jgi:hypothetical protein